MRAVRNRARERASARPRARGVARREYPHEHRILLTATLCLLAAGAVMVYSASSGQSLLPHGGNGTGYLIRYAGYGAVGLVVMQLLARRGLDLIWSLTPLLLGIAFVLLVAVRLPHIGVRVNGAQRWLGTGPLVFQPAELMKLALVLYAARLLAKRPARVRTLKGVCNPLLVVVGAACLLIASQPDLGTAIVLAFVTATLLIVAGTPARHLLTVGAVAAGLVLLFALVVPYARTRLTSFVDPWAHSGSSGFQAVQAQIAFGSGGLFGVGPGRSVQKIFYLPEANTDFILAVIGEELGVIGVSALLFLYGAIAYAGLRAARAARSAYAALVATGITSLILCQATLNAFAVLGIAPLTGVPLPFVSYGSTNLIVLLAGMGVLLNIAAGASHLRAVRPPARAPAARARSSDAPARRVRRSDAPARKTARWDDGLQADADRDRRRRDRRARRSGTGRRRRAAG